MTKFIVLVVVVSSVSGVVLAQSPMQAWVAHHGSVLGGSDFVVDVATDSLSNAIVLGKEINPVDRNVELVTIKYDNNGQVLWRAVYQGPFQSHVHEPQALAIDNRDHVIVVGSVGERGTRNHDMLIIKYDDRGQTIWESTLDSRHNDTDQATLVAVDANDDIVVCGTASRGPALDNPNEWWTVKLNGTDGSVRWQNYIGDPSLDVNHEPVDIAIDSNDNIYIVGYHRQYPQADGTSSLISYDRDGVWRWRRYSEAGSVRALAIDASDRVWVAATFTSSQSGDFDVAVRQYDTLGNRQFQTTWQGPGVSHDYAKDIVVDVDGNAYVAASYGIWPDAHAALLKLNGAGDVVWEQFYRGYDIHPWLGDEPVEVIVDDKRSSVFLAVQSEHFFGPYNDVGMDFATVGYDAFTGAQLWEAFFDNGIDDYVMGLAVASDGIIVTGHSMQQPHWDWTTIKYVPREKVRVLSKP